MRPQFFRIQIHRIWQCTSLFPIFSLFCRPLQRWQRCEVVFHKFLFLCTNWQSFCCTRPFPYRGWHSRRLRQCRCKCSHFGIGPPSWSRNCPCRFGAAGQSPAHPPLCRLPQAFWRFLKDKKIEVENKNRKKIRKTKFWGFLRFLDWKKKSGKQKSRKNVFGNFGEFWKEKKKKIQKNNKNKNRIKIKIIFWIILKKKIKIIVHGKKILNLKNIRGTKLKFGNFQEEKKIIKNENI